MNKRNLQSSLQYIIQFFKYILFSLGVVFFLLLILCFTDIPYLAYHALGTKNASLTGKPDVIILLGGSGMPSADGLIRTYYTAEAANKFKNSKIIIALPSNEKDSLGQLKLMARELMLKGIDSIRIFFEPNGYSTYSQALNIAKTFSDKKTNIHVLLITSPEHMYRAIHTFKKQGFTNVGGNASFEKPPDEEKIKDNSSKKDLRIKNLSLRYNMWSYLNYEVLVAREYSAIVYYKIKGYI